MISNKTIARIAAIQILYQYGLSSKEQNPEELVQKMIDFYNDQETKEELEIKTIDRNKKIKPSKTHLTQLVKLTTTNLIDIDKIIVLHLVSEEKINAIPRLVLAMLRVSICELKFFPETPYKVVINEFTDIASEMITENEVGFINSLLDNVAKGR